MKNRISVQISKLFILSLFVCTGGNAYAKETKFWLECAGEGFNQKFEFDVANESIRIVSYNQYLSVAQWSDDSINTSFPNPKSVSDFVQGAKKSELTDFNFNRLTGRLSVGGIIMPTADEVNKCEAEWDEDFFCRDGLVVELRDFDCAKIEPKF